MTGSLEGDAEVTELLRMSLHIDAPIERAWAVSSDFRVILGAVGDFDLEIEGSGEGSVRTITYPDGRKIVERCERLEPENRMFAYSIVSGGSMPVDGLYLARQLKPAEQSGVTLVEWTITALGVENRSSLTKPVGDLAAQTVARTERLRQLASRLEQGG